MRLPTQPNERLEFYKQLSRKCFTSRNNRIGFYNAMRMYYLFGVDDYGYDDQNGAFNKIYPHLQQINSFMFSPETTRFNIDLGPSVPSEFQSYVQPMVDLLQQQWHGTPEQGMDETVKGGVEWSQVWGSTFVKLRPRVWVDPNDITKRKFLSIRHSITPPHNIGVLREDKYGLYNQEAYGEKYMITKSQLEDELTAHPQRQRLIAYIRDMTPVTSAETQAGAGAIDRLLVTAISGDSVEGEANMIGSPLSMLYKPVIADELIEMTELYVYDSSVEDWRIVTLIGDEEPVWDRPIDKIFLPRTLPHIQICPLISNDYAFGYSRVEKIIRLQQFRNERISDIRHALRKQAHPPYSITGVAGIPDEMQYALDTPQAMLVLPDQNAQIAAQEPTIPGDQWNDIAEIDSMIDETAGLPKINQGQHTKGVRSEAQAQTMSELGATRAKSDALTIEDSLDAIATVSVRILRRYCASELRQDSDQDAQVFVPSQFPDDFTAKVDGHSSSPVFRENFEAKVFKLLALNAIDKEEALQLLDIPRKKQLITALKERIEPAEAQAHDEQIRLKELSIAAKNHRRA